MKSSKLKIYSCQQRRARMANSDFVVPGLVLGGALVLIIVFFVLYHSTVGTTEAVVVKLYRCTPRMTFDPPQCSFGVRYTVNGQEYYGLLNTSAEAQQRLGLEPGSRVEVQYKKSAPEQLMRLK